MELSDLTSTLRIQEAQLSPRDRAMRIVSSSVAVAPGSTMLNASASGRDADFPGSRGSGVSGT